MHPLGLETIPLRLCLSRGDYRSPRSRDHRSSLTRASILARKSHSTRKVALLSRQAAPPHITISARLTPTISKCVPLSALSVSSSSYAWSNNQFVAFFALFDPSPRPNQRSEELSEWSLFFFAYLRPSSPSHKSRGKLAAAEVAPDKTKACGQRRRFFWIRSRARSLRRYCGRMAARWQSSVERGSCCCRARDIQRPRSRTNLRTLSMQYI